MRDLSRRLMAAFVALSAIALIGVGCHEEVEPGDPGRDGTGDPASAEMCYTVVMTEQQTDSIGVLDIAAFMMDGSLEPYAYVRLSEYSVTAWVPSDSIYISTSGERTIRRGTMIGIIAIDTIPGMSAPVWGHDLPAGGRTEKITDQPVRVGM